MKNINCIKQYFFLLSFLLISTVRVNAQCNIDFDNLFKSMGKNDTEFYSFAINNGYNYNSNDKIFECNNLYRLLRSSDAENLNSQIVTLVYITTDSFNYMKIIEDAERFGFQFSREFSDQKTGNVYRLKNSIILTVKTVKIKDILFYNISFMVSFKD